MSPLVGPAPRRRLTGALLVALVALAPACTAEDPGPTPSRTADPVATVTPVATPVAPPSAGTTRSAVPSVPQQREDPVALDDTAEPADGVRVRLAAVRAVQATASGPGEVAGPALAVTVEVENGTDAPLDLSLTTVTLTDAAGDPGSPMSAEPARALASPLAAGESGDGVYVFTLPTDQRDPVTVEVATRPGEPLLVFRGRAAS